MTKMRLLLKKMVMMTQTKTKGAPDMMTDAHTVQDTGDDIAGIPLMPSP